jgi:hypothetical protein
MANKRAGYCVVMGQKVPVQSPRVRTVEDKEVCLDHYEMFHRGEPADRDRLGEVDARPEHQEIRPRQFASSRKRTVWRKARSAAQLENSYRSAKQRQILRMNTSAIHRWLNDGFIAGEQVTPGGKRP